MSVRDAAVAGFFYPADARALVEEVDRHLAAAAPPTEAIAVVVPHAGYVYSGPTAGEVLGRVVVPDRVVVVGPKHRAAGARAAIPAAERWRLPMAKVPVDRELADAVARETGAVADDEAHRDEHSLEVQVPFLWRRNPKLALTPLALGMLDADRIAQVGAGLARAARAAGGPVLLVASTDMSHQIPEERATRLDRLAIDRILELDPDGLIDVVVERRITMCGVIPTAAVLHAARALGASEAELVRYTTSGEASGDFDRVVGYAGIVIR